MRRALALAALAFAGLAFAGCGGGSDGPPSDEEVIRGWVEALNDGDYSGAADRFAEGAIVEQAEEIRLVDRAAVIAFNRSLPCRADLIDVSDEDGGTLGSFSLREGRTGECAEGGMAEVLFVIKDGLIEEWRQLPAAPLPTPDSETALGDLLALT